MVQNFLSLTELRNRQSQNKIFFFKLKRPKSISICLFKQKVKQVDITRLCSCESAGVVFAEIVYEVVARAAIITFAPN